MEQKKKSFGGIFKGKILDVFDIFVILMAIVSLGIYFHSLSPFGKKRSGITGFLVKNRLEKQLKKMDGIKSANIEFYGSYATAVLYAWPGNYSMYSGDVIENVYNLIEKNTNIPRELIYLYDGETGDDIFPASIFTYQKQKEEDGPSESGVNPLDGREK